MTFSFAVLAGTAAHILDAPTLQQPAVYVILHGYQISVSLEFSMFGKPPKF